MTSAEELKQEGNTCFREKRFNKAIQFYTESLQINVDLTVLGNRAQANINLGKWLDALIDCNKGLSIDSNLPKLLYRRAVVLEKLKLFEQAEKDAEKSFNLSKDAATNELLKRVQGKKNTEVITFDCAELGDEVRSDKDFVEVSIECNKVEEELNKIEDMVISTPSVSKKEVPSIPSTYGKFLSDFEYLKDVPHLFAEYFLTIPIDTYSILFDDLLCSAELSCLLEGLSAIIKQRNPPSTDDVNKCSNCLLHLTSISRFDMLAMFMSATDKTNLHAITQHMNSLDAQTLLTKFS